jgi:hypothetical protein
MNAKQVWLESGYDIGLLFSIEPTIQLIGSLFNSLLSGTAENIRVSCV